MTGREGSSGDAMVPDVSWLTWFYPIFVSVFVFFKKKPPWKEKQALRTFLEIVICSLC